MQIAVLASDAQWEEMITGADMSCFVRISLLQEALVTADALIILEQANLQELAGFLKPVLLNAVASTLEELNAGKHVLRINGWNGFLARRTWEIAGMVTAEVKNIFTALNRQYLPVSDVKGLVAIRPIAMIINEAYFALGDAVSTKSDIDIAMKLGTNYPYGPFEWAEKIGIQHVYELLRSLSISDQRYAPAPLLKKEATT
jgi:3-hydroxybutyryl-CoA dehydrogenase